MLEFSHYQLLYWHSLRLFHYITLLMSFGSICYYWTISTVTNSKGIVWTGKPTVLPLVIICQWIWPLLICHNINVFLIGRTCRTPWPGRITFSILILCQNVYWTCWQQMFVLSFQFYDASLICHYLCQL